MTSCVQLFNFDTTTSGPGYSLRIRAVPEGTVRVEGELFGLANVSFTVTALKRTDETHVRLTLKNQNLLARGLKLAFMGFAPKEIKEAVHFVSWSEIDVNLDKLLQLHPLAITSVAVPGKNGAALTVHFCSKE